MRRHVNPRKPVARSIDTDGPLPTFETQNFGKPDSPNQTFMHRAAFQSGHWPGRGTQRPVKNWPASLETDGPRMLKLSTHGRFTTAQKCEANMTDMGLFGAWFSKHHIHGSRERPTADFSGIDPFWQCHPNAETRFAAWMTRSLTLRDRDMLVMGPPGSLAGYVIAQPASRLHFPPAHDITATGVIDDHYHAELADPVVLANDGRGATRLLRAAEAAFADRGVGSAFVVCPAGWKSKLQVLWNLMTK